MVLRNPIGIVVSVPLFSFAKDREVVRETIDGGPIGGLNLESGAK